jgi:hypothetical protein
MRNHRRVIEIAESGDGQGSADHDRPACCRRAGHECRPVESLYHADAAYDMEALGIRAMELAASR